MIKKIAGFVWYDNKIIYGRALSIFSDSFNMPTTYEDWKAAVKEKAKEAKRDGWLLVRAEIDPEAFIAWCKARGYKVNSEARSAFADEAAGEYLKTGKGSLIDPDCI